MAISRRRDIINEIVTQLKKINGGVSTFDASYTYLSKINNNVFRNVKFLDEINDFPSVYLQAGKENRIYHTGEMVEAFLPVVIRCYVKTEVSVEKLENLAQDIEHVLYNLPVSSNLLGIQDIIIDSISNDEGLLTPFGIGEIFFTITYELS